MAEERLIDDDKDKKYRFRKNENGEDELVIDDSPEEEAAEEINFEAPDETPDDETAVLTPEQIEARRLIAEEERLAKEKRFAEILERCRAELAAGNYATALEAAVEAEAEDNENGEVYALKLEIYTRSFTDYSACEGAAEAAAEVKKYTSAERKAEMKDKAGDGLAALIGREKAELEAISSENDAKKAERAELFKADAKKVAIFFAAAGVPFVVFLALAIVFSGMMFSTTTGEFIVLTIVFAALAFVFFIVFAFAARALNIAMRRVRLNKKNSSTQLGRDVIAAEKRVAALEEIYGAING